MVKHVKSIAFRALFVIVPVILVFISILMVREKEAEAWTNMGQVGAPGCPVPDYNPSSTWTNSSDTEGTSEVITRVKLRSQKDKAYTGSIYVKPGDEIDFAHCYLPGAQKLASQLITVSHPTHISSFSSQPAAVNGVVTFPVTYKSLFELSDNEANSHLTVYESYNGRNMLDDGEYQWIPNFSRVNRMDGQKGGMGIFNNLKVGESGVINTINGWTVGNPNDGVNWHVGTGYENNGRGYMEEQFLPYPNHAKVVVGEDENYDWPCSWKHQVLVTSSSSEYEDLCKYQSGTRLDTGCTKQHVGPWAHTECNSGDPGSSKQFCQHCGGKWTEETVPVFSYRNPCYKTETEDYTCKHGNKYTYFEHSTVSGNYTSASIIIPYNYTLTGSIEIDDTVEIYAGETAKLKNAKVSILDRENTVTDGTYATEVPLIKTKVVTYVARNADGSSEVSGTRTEQAMPDHRPSNPRALEPEQREITVTASKSINVPDTFAGYYLCVQLMVFPRNSGDFTNIDNENGDGNWSSPSNPSCKIIAKKPTFQVWGGSVFTNGAISGTRAIKNNLYGDSSRPYQILPINTANVFSSWSELSVVSLGTNKSLASSTALGGAKGRLETYPSTGLCSYESFLTYANFDNRSASQICNGNDIKNANGNFGNATASVNKKSMIDDIVKHDENKITIQGADGGAQKEVGMTIGNVGTYYSYVTPNGKLVRYSYSKNSRIKIGESKLTKGTIAEVTGSSMEEVPVGTTYIVHSKGDVVIGGNIFHEDGVNTNYDDISKLIIYAKNIYIRCQVKRVDAILIAENKIDTCTDWGGVDGDGNILKPSNPPINDSSRSIPLRINGAVIADQLVLNRTFGATPGANRVENGIERGSGVPAEVINYDTTMLLWGRSQADTSSSGRVDITYTHELAPRY